MTIIRIQHVEIPDEEWKAIEARKDLNPLEQLLEATESINAKIPYEELATYEEFYGEV